MDWDVVKQFFKPTKYKITIFASIVAVLFLLWQIEQTYYFSWGEQVAKAIGISWNTTQLHLYKLQAEGLIKGKRVGRQNQWMLTRKK